MSVDYFPCWECISVINDYDFYANCGDCGKTFCKDCYEELVKKYGVGTESQQDYYGEDVLLACNKCSKEGIKETIKQLEKKLAELETLTD